MVLSHRTGFLARQLVRLPNLIAVPLREWIPLCIR